MTDPDLHTVRADDRLLDRLGRGAPADGDEVERMLAAWRRSLPAAGPTDALLLAAVTEPARRPKRRMVRTSLGVAASVVLICGGVTVAAGYARPDSPLWPVTRLVYGSLADSRVALDAATRAVSDARAAAGDGRYADAARLLATATRLIDEVDEPQAARRLRNEIAMVRHMLPAANGTATTSHVPTPTESLGVDAPPVDQPAPPRQELPTGERTVKPERGEPRPAEPHDDQDDHENEDDEEHGEDEGEPGESKPHKGVVEMPQANLTLPSVPTQPGL